MDAHAPRIGTDAPWRADVRIDEGIVRVRAGEEARWFIVPDRSSCSVTTEATLFPAATAEQIAGTTGLLVPRCEGGLLDEALRARGGLEPALALGVLDEVGEVLQAAPAAAEGASRVCVRALACDSRGDVVLLPGRTRDAAARTDAAELGEILHLALTGQTWEDTGVPVHLSVPEAPVDVVRLVTDLLEDPVGAVDLAALRSRIASLGPSRDRGFRPAECGVDEDSAPTATLGADLVRELRGARRADDPEVAGAAPRGESATRPGAERRRRDSSARKGGPGRKARRGKTGRSEKKGRPETKDRPGKADRPVRWGRTAVLGLAGLGVCAGIALMIQPGVQGPESDRASVQRAVQNDQTGEAHAGGRGLRDEDPRDEDPRDGDPSDQDSSEEDPLSAVVDLSRARAAAIADADRESLRSLTAPGSPAAAADAALALEECAEDCGDTQVLHVTDARLLETNGAAESVGTADGARASVGATMSTGRGDATAVVFVLERSEGRWLVHSVGRAPD